MQVLSHVHLHSSWLVVALQEAVPPALNYPETAFPTTTSTVELARPGFATLRFTLRPPFSNPRAFFTRMASINIRRDIQDTFYRYKMPKLTVKVQAVIDVRLANPLD